MRRIVVLGSGPGAILPNCNALYCANASIGAYSDEIRTGDHGVVTNVVSGWNLSAGRRQKDSPDAEYSRNLHHSVIKGPSDKLLLLAPHDEATELRREVLADGYPCEVEIITPRDCDRLTTRIGGLREPLIAREVMGALASMPLRQSLRGLRRFARARLRQARGLHCDPPELFRASTGLVALLVAVDRHGSDAEYVLTGISFGDRSSYKNAIRPLASSTGWLNQHVFADLAILRAMSRRYTIRSTAELGVKRVDVLDDTSGSGR